MPCFTLTHDDRQRVRRAALAGNALALAVLALVVAAWPRLFADRVPAARDDVVHVETPAERVLLIVVDGLRLDVARDRETMPALHALSGGVSEARVEQLVPSTIAGIRAITESVVAAPGAFVLDFASTRAPNGGVLEATGEGGVFVAGPRLWLDLYGPWIDGAFVTPFSSRSDAGAIRAAEAALRQGKRRLVVAHLGALDWVAHEQGGASAAYLRAARSADDGIATLAAATAGRTAIVVTSDHGVTAAGGHAGAERDVLAVPLAVRWPGIALGDDLRQTDVPRLALALLGLNVSAPAHASPPLAWRAWPLAAFASMLALLHASVSCEDVASWRPTTLCVALWLALPLAWLSPLAAALLACLALLAALPRPTHVCGLVIAPAAGLALAALRLTTPDLPMLALTFPILVTLALLARAPHALRLAHLSFTRSPNERALLAALMLLAVTFASPAAALGVALAAVGTRVAVLASPHAPVFAGVALAAWPAAALGLAGESASLSTVTVADSVRLLDLPLGLAWTVLAVTLLQLAPILAAAVGTRPALLDAPPAHAGTLLGAAAATSLAQAVVAIATLLLAANVALQALALGLLLRAAFEGALLCLFAGVQPLISAVSPALIARPSLIPRDPPPLASAAHAAA